MTPYDFASLFQKAIREWPDSLNMNELQHQNGDRYSVSGLGRQLEDIERRHIGTKEEMIWRELHWAIFTIVHSSAKSLSELKPSSIRAHTVQRIFKQRLQSAIAANDPRWTVEDFFLANAYLQDADI